MVKRDRIYLNDFEYHTRYWCDRDFRIAYLTDYVVGYEEVGGSLLKFNIYDLVKWKRGRVEYDGK